MSLNGVQLYMKAQLDQLPMPLDLGTLQAFVAPPDPGDGTDPCVYIWGSTQRETRQTMPRAQPGNLGSGGFKKIQHQLDLWVIWFGDSEDARADSMFPLVLDTINARLRNLLMPVAGLSDPHTGAPFDILMVGEELSTDYAPVHATQDERWWVYNGRIICAVTEKIQA